MFNVGKKCVVELSGLFDGRCRLLNVSNKKELQGSISMDVVAFLEG